MWLQAFTGAHHISTKDTDRHGLNVLVLPLPKKSSPADQMLWYNAASKWEQILRSKELEYWFQLKPGTIVIFDNHRVLHGRSAFTGLRRICGGYSE